MQDNFSPESLKKKPLIVDSSNFIQIGLASSDEIRNWAERSSWSSFGDRTSLTSSSESSMESTKGRTQHRTGLLPAAGFQEIGEVKRPDTLNYRTFKPEKDGLFCERIFGPVNDWMCSCGQCKEQSYGSAAPYDHEKALTGKLRPTICPNCQVEVTTSRFRRYRMGYISLACPVTHIWYLNSRPNVFSILLKMPTKYMKKIAYYKAYSPSFAYPEYLSGLISPGGDFFDNEWEYLHTWLGGKHSSEDIAAPWTSRFPDSRSESAILGRSLIEANTQHRTQYSIGYMGVRNQLAERIQLEAPVDQKSNGTGISEWNRPTVEHQEKKMPESPNWLLNTGAEGLLNQFETRDWPKEIQKLESELAYSSLAASDGVAPVPFRSSFAGAKLGHSPNSFAEGGADSSLTNVNTERGVSPAELHEKGIEYVRSATSNSSEKENEFLLKRRKTRVRRLKLLKTFQKSGLALTGMIFSSLPVLPPELRPIIQLGAGQLASSDVNDLYRRILSRNNRLKYYLYETHFVEFLIRSEQQLVQLAVDALLENGKTTQVRHTSGQKRLYKSLSDRIGGKQGRFRMNLLGKRVDYSGRSVIVVGPKLHISQCGLPYEMAQELFQPFLLRHMLEFQLAKTIRSAKNILRLNKPLARQFLHRVVQAHPILLNRAPTLHRLGIQAFQPLLVFGRAIHLHPLVCPAFNADFDGDQMAVHLPLSPQARVEARLLMLASGNWLSASTGQPNLLPSQDMVLGFYYVSLEKYGYQKGRGLFFRHLDDALQAYQTGELDLHSQIWVKTHGEPTQVREAVWNQVSNEFAKRKQQNIEHKIKHKAKPAPKLSKQLNTPLEAAPFSPQLRFDFQKNQTPRRITGDALGRSIPSTKHTYRMGEGVRNQISKVLSMECIDLRSNCIESTFGRTEHRNQHQTRLNTKLEAEPDSVLFESSLQMRKEDHRRHLRRRFQKDVHNPIEIRLNQNGVVAKMYTSYKWKEDPEKNNFASYIRTTPGRILLNQIMQKYL